MRKLSLLMLIIPFFVTLAYAHGIHFHSIAELSAHIHGHVAELQALQNQHPQDKARIKRECSELEVHARQYLQLANELLEKQKSEKTAFYFSDAVRVMKELEIISRQAA